MFFSSHAMWENKNLTSRRLKQKSAVYILAIALVGLVVQPLVGRAENDSEESVSAPPATEEQVAPADPALTGNTAAPGTDETDNQAATEADTSASDDQSAAASPAADQGSQPTARTDATPGSGAPPSHERGGEGEPVSSPAREQEQRTTSGHCTPLDREHLTGSLTTTGEAAVTNHSQRCSYQVGLASYKMFEQNIDTQELFDSTTTWIHPGETLHLKVKVPECAYQVDLFQGSVITSFAGGVRYGPRLIDWRQVLNPPPFCGVSKPEADVAVEKSVNVGTPFEGQTIMYFITVTNHGPDTAHSIVLRDVLPDGVTFVEAKTTASSFANGEWRIPTLASEESQRLKITATVNAGRAGQRIINTATVVAGEHDPDQTNNTAHATIIPVARPGQHDPCRPIGHENLTGTITADGHATVTNHSEQCVYDVGLAVYKMFDENIDHQELYDSQTDQIHPHQTLELQVVLPGCAYQIDLFQGPLIESFEGGVRYGPRLIDWRQVLNPPPFCGVSEPTADLAVTKTVSAATPREQQTITYTITASNLGLDPATEVRVSERFPAGLTFVSSTTTVGMYDHATRLWTIGRLERNQRVMLQITATVNASTAGQTITNAVAVQAAEHDPNLANNHASVDITVPRPTPPPTGGGAVGGVSTGGGGGGGGTVARLVDLVLTKTADRATATIGETIVFAITLTNRGPDTATSVDMTDILSPGLDFVSAVTTTGSYTSSNSTGHWMLPILAPDASATLTLRAFVNGTQPCGTLTNAATVTSADSERVNTDNNASVSLTVPCVGGVVITPPPEVLSARTELPRTGFSPVSLVTMLGLLMALPFALSVWRREHDTTQGVTV